MSGIRRVLSRSRNREKKTPAKSRSLPRSAAAPVVALAAETDATSQNRAASLPRPRASRPQVLPRQSTSAAVKDDDASESTHRSTPPLPPLPSRHTSTPTIQRSHSHQPTSTQTLRQKYGRPSTLLGKGANGNCYLVRRDSDSRVFAVKQFRRRKEDESPRAYLKKLTNEYCIGTLLHHPNVVQTLDIIFEEKGQAYEIMELCQGGDLYEAIASRPMTADEANCIFAQLIQGVAYLHSLGVCHRDLKPENCLFDTGNKLKIIDFGSADVVKNPFGNVVRKSTGKCGSGPYMAPEEFTATEYDGRKVDVWACGIIYLAMVFRRFPWAAAIQTDTHFASYLRHDGRNRFLDTLPEAPKRVVSRMLDPNPETRFTIEECLADEWIQEIIICRGCVTRHTHGRSRKL
ncbi:kinase-like domain-containing protein [Phlyctochytrium arcticum]|nr:kinase-like domain-containing protein [Phlyctochytrium arcticum]